MKKIAALTSIPDNEKFKFTNRASTMMSKVSSLQLFDVVASSADMSIPRVFRSSVADPSGADPGLNADRLAIPSFLLE